MAVVVFDFFGDVLFGVGVLLSGVVGCF